MGFPGGSEGEEFPCNVGDLGLIPGLGRSPGGEHGNPLQYSCLESPHGQRSLAGYSPWGSQFLPLYISSFNSHNTPSRWLVLYPCGTDKETEVQRSYANCVTNAEGRTSFRNRKSVSRA